MRGGEGASLPEPSEWPPPSGGARRAEPLLAFVLRGMLGLDRGLKLLSGGALLWSEVLPLTVLEDVATHTALVAVGDGSPSP